MSSTYVMSSQPFVMQESREKRYELTIRDLPNERKPRERLISEGPGALLTSELLAVVLVNGTSKESILEMTSRIAQEYGDRSLLLATDAKALATDLDIPIGKAMQIVACGELGRRFFRRTRDGAPVIRTAKDVFDYVVDMRNLSKEHLRGLYLNAHYQLVHDETISVGTVDANLVHPREVFRPALAYAAAALILVHNHPSGNLQPSDADLQITRQLYQAGHLLNIELIDHIVVTADSFTSIPVI